MASITNLPFSFKPVSSPIRVTSSYTVPVGRVARVCIYYFATRHISLPVGATPLTSQNVTVNGVEVLRERAVGGDIISGTFASSSYQMYFSNNGLGCSFYGIYSQETSSNVFRAFDGEHNIQETNQNFASVSFNQNGNVAINGTMVLENEQHCCYLWLKAGDVINGSGNWCAIVNLFEVGQ